MKPDAPPIERQIIRRAFDKAASEKDHDDREFEAELEDIFNGNWDEFGISEHVGTDCSRRRRAMRPWREEPKH